MVRVRTSVGKVDTVRTQMKINGRSYMVTHEVETQSPKTKTCNCICVIGDSRVLCRKFSVIKSLSTILSC